MMGSTNQLHQLALQRSMVAGKRSLTARGTVAAVLFLCVTSALLVTQTPTPFTSIGLHSTSNANDWIRVSTLMPRLTFSVPGAQSFPLSFTYGPAVPAVGYPVTFNATVSGGTAPYTFLWSFGDGINGTNNPISHTYTLTSSFNV